MENKPADTGSEAILQAIADLLRTGTDPDVLQAQRMLLRRLALTGDVPNSRVPPPRNITEVGGYLNLLQQLQEPAFVGQTLSAALGVAGPNPPAGWLDDGPPIKFISIPNNRPEGTAQPSIPLTLKIRSDMLLPWQAAIKGIQEAGCALPLIATNGFLPNNDGSTIMPTMDMLFYLGRSMIIAPGTFLIDPDTDSLVVAKNDQNSGFELTARALTADSIVEEQNWAAYQCSTTSCQVLASKPRKLLSLKPYLSSAGWYSPGTFETPTTVQQSGSVGKLINTTSLLVGKTSLYSELTLLYTESQILNSTFSDKLNWLWDGETFAA